MGESTITPHERRYMLLLSTIPGSLSSALILLCLCALCNDLSEIEDQFQGEEDGIVAWASVFLLGSAYARRWFYGVWCDTLEDMRIEYRAQRKEVKGQEALAGDDGTPEQQRVATAAEPRVQNSAGLVIPPPPQHAYRPSYSIGRRTLYQPMPVVSLAPDQTNTTVPAPPPPQTKSPTPKTASPPHATAPEQPSMWGESKVISAFGRLLIFLGCIFSSFVLQARMWGEPKLISAFKGLLKILECIFSSFVLDTVTLAILESKLVTNDKRLGLARLMEWYDIAHGIFVTLVLLRATFWVLRSLCRSLKAMLVPPPPPQTKSATPKAASPADVTPGRPRMRGKPKVISAFERLLIFLSSILFGLILTVITLVRFWETISHWGVLWFIYWYGRVFIVRLLLFCAATTFWLFRWWCSWLQESRLRRLEKGERCG